MKIGPYSLDGEVGRGGMGVVYRGRGPDGAPVALKVLLAALAAKIARFEREKRLLGMFTARDGFVPLLDSGTTPHGPFLVMPFLGGGTLRGRLEQGALTVAETVELGVALAGAIAAAHEKGIVHRDLKPENVLFTHRGAETGSWAAPLIADLGLAKHFDHAAPGASQSVSLSLQTDVRGTAGYMAPEQVEDAKNVGPAADVFALGAILYECLAGEPAFSGSSVLEVVRRVGSGQFTALAKATKDVPRWLTAVVERALSTDPDRRFADAGELRAALERGGSGRGRTGLVAAAALLLLAGGGVAVGLAMRRDGGTPAPTAPTPETSVPLIPAKPAAPLNTSEAESLEERARGLLEKGDNEGALELAERAVALAPKRAQAYSRRGSVRISLGDTAGALADYDRAIELDPSFFGAWHNRGMLKMDRDPESAFADFTKATELNPQDAVAWFGRGALKIRAKDDKAARPFLDRAIELDPKFVKALVVRGSTRVQTETRAAVEDFDRAIALDPTNGPAHNDRAAAKLMLGDRPGAIADFETLTRLDPRNKESWITLAKLRTMIGDHAKARDALGEVIALDPKHAWAWCARGTARSELGDHEGALADLAKSLELDPKAGSTWASRGAARRRAGDLAGDLADCDRAIELEPRNGAIYRERGKARRALGDRAAGLADLDKAVELAPKALAFLYDRGVARAEDGDDAGALADLKRFVAGAPNDKLAPAARSEIDRIERKGR